MARELSVLSGSLLFRNIQFSYLFSENELRLIPPEEKSDEIAWGWKLKPLGKGAFSLADPIEVKEEYLVGFCNETKQEVVFFPERNSVLILHNQFVIIRLSAYILFKQNNEVEEKTLQEKRYIAQFYISGIEGNPLAATESIEKFPAYTSGLP